MKTTTFALILLLTGFSLQAQTVRPTPNRNRSSATNIVPTGGAPVIPVQPTAVPPSAAPVAPAAPNAPQAGAAATEATPPEEMIAAGTINFQGVDVSQVLEVYAKLVGRTLLRGGVPPASIILKTETPLTKKEAIEALQAVLALNGISVVNIGDKFVKVGPSADANGYGAAFNEQSANQLPDVGGYVTRIVQLKYTKPSVMVPIIQPFAKLANSILPVEDNGILVLRDNAENVKRMLEMIDRVDVSVPAEYISEVIPIKYALANDIATALNSLGGTGGGTVSIGTASTTGSGGNGLRPNTSGASGTGGFGASGGLNNSQGIGTQQRQAGGLGGTANGSPTGGSFQNRLQSIIQRAAGGNQQDQIQIFGQTKIIADQRSNSLLVFATRQDMATITNIVAKLDVLLSQVLIESVIMEVSLGNNLDYGVSAVQKPTQFNNSDVIGGGIMNNGNGGFLDVLKAISTNGAASLTGSFPSNSASGLSYFGNIGDQWAIAVHAAESDDTVNIIQKPRIQTFQAQAANFFVGSTVPYITGSTYGSAYGNSSSYQQLSVGVSLQVTPFINPDGLVVMQIDEEIDDISGYTTIDGNPVPNTSKKTLNSNVAVKDRDSIILGGAIYSSKSNNKSGVPILQDIPLLGVFFSARTSTKSRQELLVLLRPTVLKTPEIAALQADVEKARLPGIAHAERQNDKDELKQVQAEERLEQLKAQRDARITAKQMARDKKLGVHVSTNMVPDVLPDPTPASDQ